MHLANVNGIRRRTPREWVGVVVRTTVQPHSAYKEWGPRLQQLLLQKAAAIGLDLAVYDGSSVGSHDGSAPLLPDMLEAYMAAARHEYVQITAVLLSRVLNLKQLPGEGLGDLATRAQQLENEIPRNSHHRRAVQARFALAVSDPRERATLETMQRTP